jgi:hypothetical protein
MEGKLGLWQDIDFHEQGDFRFIERSCTINEQVLAAWRKCALDYCTRAFGAMD